MSVSYSERSRLGDILLMILIIVVVAWGALWFFNRPAGRELNSKVDHAITSLPAKIDHISDGRATSRDIDRKLDKAGASASSALSKAANAASAAVSETAADIKAATDKQKQQNAARASKTAD